MADKSTKRKFLPFIACGFFFTIMLVTRLSSLKSRVGDHSQDLAILSDRRIKSLGNISMHSTVVYSSMTMRINLEEDIMEVEHTEEPTTSLSYNIWEEEGGTEKEIEDVETVVRKTIAMNDKQRKEYWLAQINKKHFSYHPNNPGFVLHNKLPKSGSTTMNAILDRLSRVYQMFTFRKLTPEDFPIDATSDLINYTRTHVRDHFLLLKHQYFVNFTRYNRPMPTYINVVREPVSWFVSKYYFQLNGWLRNPAHREHIPGGTAKTIDECIQLKQTTCTAPTTYIHFFCGTEEFCSLHTKEDKRAAVERAKYNILHEFYAVGVLERFEETLKLFSFLMPQYFANDIKAWKAKGVQLQQKQTKTVKKQKISEKAENYLRKNLLKEEIELYEFILEVFDHRLRL